jgi:hypothetical protein
MKCTVELELADDKTTFAKEFFNAISFVKKVKVVSPNEITNPIILQSIKSYETGSVKPTPLTLSELKELIHA